MQIGQLFDTNDLANQGAIIIKLNTVVNQQESLLKQADELLTQQAQQIKDLTNERDSLKRLALAIDKAQESGMLVIEAASVPLLQSDNPEYPDLP